MMSRITINLKKHAVEGGQSNVSELAFGHTGMTTGVTMAAHHSATENTSSTPSAARSREEVIITALLIFKMISDGASLV